MTTADNWNVSLDGPYVKPRRGLMKPAPSSGFDRVFRLGFPAGFKGRACRILARPWGATDTRGSRLPNVGAETIVVEFENGEQLRCIRSAAVPLDSKMGRQAVARVARGDKRPPPKQAPA